MVVVMRPVFALMLNSGVPSFTGTCFSEYVTVPLLPLSASVAITVRTNTPATFSKGFLDCESLYHEISYKLTEVKFK